MSNEIDRAEAINKLVTAGGVHTESISDGYHTFGELYNHRAVLFSVVCSMFRHKAWKSKQHDDGTMYENYFIVGLETPTGDATYHYEMSYWDMFDVVELPTAPKYDGHTSADAIERIAGLKQVLDCMAVINNAKNH